MFKRTANCIALTVILSILIIASCAKKPVDLPCSQVMDLSGKAMIVNARHVFTDAYIGMSASIGSQITVAPESRIVMGTDSLKRVSASEYSVFSIDSIIGSGSLTSLAISLLEGKLLCSVPTRITIAMMPVQVTVRLIDRNASLMVRAGKDTRSTVVKAIGGSASITVLGRQPAVIPACCKALVNGDGAISRPIPLNEKDFSEIELLTDKRTADSIINNAACLQTMAIENNLPPQWEKSPIAVCRANKIFFDTLLAKDPEGSPITYSLIKGPPGMDLEPKTGILRFLPKKAAVYSIQISAADSGNLCANMNYELTVTALSRKSTPGKLCAVINAPGIAAPNEPVVIDASRSASTNAPLQTLSFRFDIDGNCKWESPESGGFGVDAAVTHTFKSEGAYIVQVLVKNSAGKTASAKCSIVIHAKPVAKIVVSPPQLTVHQECTLDASQSLVGKIGAPFEVRWDLDNNGIWDFPKNGSYTAMKSVKNAWTAPGIYSVILEIKDRLGAQAWASAEIEVKPETIIPVKPKPDGIVPKTMVPVKCTTTFEAPHASAVVSSPATISAGGIYQTHVYSPLTFAGTALYPNGKIIRYAWDFYGKGSFDTASETSGKVTHVYRLSGTYRPVLKVTTNDNKTLYDTAFVTVINTPPVANAGKDVFSKKGKKVHLKGTGEDLDDGIGLYEWDFTNDGIYEWSSPMSAETEHAFNEYSYAVLRVTDRNGATGKDTLRVVICPAGMVSVEQGMFCIDEYEWSNNKGAVPEREMTYDDAVKKCVESGKHLCSGQEWESACAGMHNRQYPKSKAPPTQNCNVIGNRAYPNKIAPSGSFSDCRSPSGAYDMNGNVAEWTESEKPDSAFVYGGSWHNDLGNAQCSSKLLLKKSSGYFYVGFRCCK